jgi:hypothetical protein
MKIPSFLGILSLLFTLVFYPATGRAIEKCPEPLERALTAPPPYRPIYSGTSDNSPEKKYLREYEDRLSNWAATAFWNFSVQELNACAQKKKEQIEKNNGVNNRDYNFQVEGSPQQRFLMVDEDGNYGVFLMLKKGPVTGANYFGADNPRNVGGYELETAQLGGKPILVILNKNESSDMVCDTLQSYSLNEKTLKISPFPLFLTDKGEKKSEVSSCESVSTMNTYPSERSKLLAFKKGRPVPRFFIYEDRCEAFTDKCRKPIKETYAWNGNVFVSDRKNPQSKK